MTNNHSPLWITIPDEQSAPKRLPAEKKASHDKVQNKVFWSAGFVALVAFGIILFLPKQFSQQLMQAQLFDGGFQVVPDFEEQTQENAFFEGNDQIETPQDQTPEVQSQQGQSLESASNQNVIEAEAEPVEIQIEPLADGAAETEVQAATQEQIDAEAVLAAEDAEMISTETASEASTNPGSEVLAPEATDEFTQMVANLTAELENLKADSAKKDQEIENLSQILSSGLQPSASEQVIPAVSTTQTLGNQNNPQAMVSGNGYRYNTHTVTVSPHEVLAQNQLSTSQFQQQALQGNIVQGTNQHDNSLLSGLQNQPETGPAETMLLAFVLASVAILGYGIFKVARA